jgi:FeS cluster assembly scaffold protein NifU
MVQKSTDYSEKVMDHFRNPRNVGTLEGDDVAVGKVGNPVCGDIMEFFIRVKDDKIVDAKFRTFGCGSAIATSSMTTELVIGMDLDEALKVTRADVAEGLDGLPPIKMHCSNLASDALHEAIMNYRRGKGELPPIEEEKEEEPECLVGKDEFLDKGVYLSLDNPEDFKDKRTIVLHSGDESIKAAIELTEYTDRVILLTPEKEVVTTSDMKEQLDHSDVKVLYESRLLEVRGEYEMEKVLIKNLDEDEDYELFVDAVLIID